MGHLREGSDELLVFAGGGSAGAGADGVGPGGYCGNGGWEGMLACGGGCIIR